MAKQTRDFREVQEEYKEKIIGLCCVCEKPVSGWYGAWEGGGTCSKKCEQVKSSQPKFPPPSPEFLQQLEQHDGLDEGFESDM